MNYYLYIIECNNGSFYTGITTDVERRYQEHSLGSKKCKYTRSFPPKELVAYWCLESKTLALKMECKVKRLSRLKKIELIANPELLIDYYNY